MKRDSFLCSTSLLHAQNLASAGLVLQGAEPSGVQAPKDGHVGVLLFLPASAPSNPQLPVILSSRFISAPINPQLPVTHRAPRSPHGALPTPHRGLSGCVPQDGAAVLSPLPTALPPPCAHPHPGAASQLLTKRNCCQMKYITIKYLILLVSGEQPV